MSKIIVYDQQALDAIKRGVRTSSRAVSRTLGPRGRNVLLQKSYGPPVVTKDGVTVAKEIELEDPFENIARGWWAKSPQRQMTSRGMERQRQRSWLKQSSARDCGAW